MSGKPAPISAKQQQHASSQNWGGGRVRETVTPRTCGCSVHTPPLRRAVGAPQGPGQLPEPPSPGAPAAGSGSAAGGSAEQGSRTSPLSPHQKHRSLTNARHAEPHCAHRVLLSTRPRTHQPSRASWLAPGRGVPTAQRTQTKTLSSAVFTSAQRQTRPLQRPVYPSVCSAQGAGTAPCRPRVNKSAVALHK